MPPAPTRRSLNLSWRERYLRPWLPIAIGLLALASFATGLIAFFIQFNSPKHPAADLSVPFYKTVQLFLLNSGAEDDAEHPSNLFLVLARILAAAFFVVISSTVILRVLDEIRLLPRYLTRRDHDVICGVGRIGLQLLDGLADAGRARRTVVIDLNPNSPWLEYARRKGAEVVVGDASRADVLQRARAEYAKTVFVVTGDDGINLEAAAELAQLAAAHRPEGAAPLRIHAHVADAGLADALRPSDGGPGRSGPAERRVFTVPRISAIDLVTGPLLPHSPAGPGEFAHYVVLGFGTMGRTLTEQLARLGHFANLGRARFTVLDRDIMSKAREFLSRHPRFCSWDGVAPPTEEFERGRAEADRWDRSAPLPAALNADVEGAVQYVARARFGDLPPAPDDEAFAARLADWATEAGAKLVVFVCGGADRTNFDDAVRLREALGGRAGTSGVPIFAWLPNQPALAAGLAADRRGGLVPFGECRQSLSLESVENPLRERIGRLFHASWAGRGPGPGDGWEAAPESDRESSRQAADHAVIKLWHLGHNVRVAATKKPPAVKLPEFSEHQLDALARMEHNRYVAERLMSGWRCAAPDPAGEHKAANKARKMNPTLVPWDDLSEDEKKKDRKQFAALLAACQGQEPSLELVKRPGPDDGRGLATGASAG